MFFKIAFPTVSVCLGAAYWASCIEPNLVQVTSEIWKLPKKYSQLDGLRVVQISDLHYGEDIPEKFLKKVSNTVRRLHPDIILFSGDFLRRSQIENRDKLLGFLCSLEAKLGSYCIFGNHDYSKYISGTGKGLIDIISPEKSQAIKRAAASIWNCLKKQPSQQQISKRTAHVPTHKELFSLIKETPFTLLHNESIFLPIGLNIVGLGDYFAQRCLPKEAFVNYKEDFPGFILSHNPDSISLLKKYPGEWIFSGHTHGPQISPPFIMKKFFRKLSGLQNIEYCRGKHFLAENKILYVNRGLGGLKRIRFGSKPEILFLECKQ
ncbi:UDP-2,3-diacylglucosamine diphosphatase LpxG [Chlamydiifrater phoenicopteri]|uniref:UDP-2,3-diacylglucosamine diphosphatase LpxG n=1 Tax=Chlamydiifrater phoenicopteri TaxID=2681469 RepID=UPI001BCFEE2C|nr:UDP-2,3-diacylglucosamine diphosphatase LpxG [Chlamydiifrater phoenicopteri]